MILPDNYRATSTDTKNDDDVIIQPTLTKALPIFAFEDGFIDSIKIYEETVTNTEPSAKPYAVIDNTNIDSMFLLNIHSKISGRYSLYYIKDNINAMVNIPIVPSLTPDFLKNKRVLSNFIYYHIGYDNYMSDSKVLYSYLDKLEKVPEPTNNFGDTVKIVTIAVHGLKSVSQSSRYKINDSGGNDIYVGSDLLTFLELDPATVGWDNKLNLYTLLQTTNIYLGQPTFIGKQNVSKIYLPLT